MRDGWTCRTAGCGTINHDSRMHCGDCHRARPGYRAQAPKPAKQPRIEGDREVRLRTMEARLDALERTVLRLAGEKRGNDAPSE